jgi:4-hydroxyphenylpyruvate dioxygenase-like putative hemolysin
MQMKRVFIANLQNQYKIDQPFFEIIQRMGAKGFGAGILKLFESIERAGIRNAIKTRFFM